MALNSSVTATFSTAMDPSTVTSASFEVKSASGPVSGTVTYDANTQTATFVPSTNLAPNTGYEGEITTGAASSGGTPLASNYKWTFIAGPIQVLFSFNGTNGADPKGSLTLDGGTLWGRTAYGGPGWESKDASQCPAQSTDPTKCPGGGEIFSVPAPGIGNGGGYINIPFFSPFPGGAGGYQPHHDSMTLLGSTLYGAALFSGDISLNGGGNGSLFSFNSTASLLIASEQYQVIHAFTGPPDGANEHSCPAVASDNQTLYGITAAGGTNSSGVCGSSGCGIIYAYNTSGGAAPFCPPSLIAGPYCVLYSFQSSAVTPPALCSAASGCTGAVSHGRPLVMNVGTLQNPIDVLFGITRQGGLVTDSNNKGNGVVYAFVPSTGQYFTLHAFAGQNQSSPQDSDGAWTDHGNLVLASFTPASGGQPATAVMYGMTTNGGNGSQPANPVAGPGVIFSIIVNIATTPTVAPSVASYGIAHTFGGTATDLITNQTVPDGYNPYGSLLYLNGSLYGMTRNGGLNGGGAIFRLMLPNFDEVPVNPYALLTSFDTQSNNLSSCDTTKPTPSTCDFNGSAPIDNLIASTDGSTLYGMTQSGGANDPSNTQTVVSFGTVFSIAANP